jgi:hypothetical protein
VLSECEKVREVDASVMDRLSDEELEGLVALSFVERDAVLVAHATIPNHCSRRSVHSTTKVCLLPNGRPQNEVI